MGRHSSQSETVISVVAPHLQQPVSDLVAKLIAIGFRRGDRVSADFYENGYSASAILLIAAMMESMLQRDRYFLQKSKPRLKLKDESAAYFKECLGYRRHQRVREFFDLRNSLAHNHIWEINFRVPDAGYRTHRTSTLLPGSHRLKNAPGPNARIPRTSLVKFNILPARVDRTDLIKAFDVFNHAMEHLHKKEQVPVEFLNHAVRCGGKRSLPFKLLVDELRNAL